MLLLHQKVLRSGAPVQEGLWVSAGAAGGAGGGAAARAGGAHRKPLPFMVSSLTAPLTSTFLGSGFLQLNASICARGG